MIILLHGDNIKEIYTSVDQFVPPSIIPTRLDAKKSSTEELVQSLSSQSLFEEKRAVIIEKLIASRKNKDKLLTSRLNEAKGSKVLTVILIEELPLTPKQLSEIPHTKAYPFLLPKYFYSFLDNMSPKKKKEIVALYHKVAQTTAEELIFYSLIKRVRQLLYLLMPNSDQLEDIKSISPWQKSKLASQAKLWKLPHLVHFYNKLFEIELKMKQSELPLSLGRSLDILLLEELN